MNLVSQANSPFKAAAVAHPAFVDAKDAPGITIPFLSLPTQDESKEDVAAWEKAITVKGGQSPTQKYWKYCLEMIQKGEIDSSLILTHKGKLAEGSLTLKRPTSGYRNSAASKAFCTAALAKHHPSGHFRDGRQIVNRNESEVL